VIHFNKVTFLSERRIAMQLRSPSSFCPSETSVLPVHLSCHSCSFQRDVLNLDPPISCTTTSRNLWPSAVMPDEEWEPRVLLYLASANTALNRDLNSSSWRYTRRALWIFPFTTRDTWPTTLRLVERATGVNYIYWEQAVSRFAQITKSGELRRSCSCKLAFIVFLSVDDFVR